MTSIRTTNNKPASSSSSSRSPPVAAETSTARRRTPTPSAAAVLPLMATVIKRETATTTTTANEEIKVRVSLAVSPYYSAYQLRIEWNPIGRHAKVRQIYNLATKLMRCCFARLVRGKRCRILNYTTICGLQLPNDFYFTVWNYNPRPMQIKYM